jgi:2-polyprenyl-3-methyl-5-hydroxy-6-metoxy-1,4-benzoquinol methylase
MSGMMTAVEAHSLDRDFPACPVCSGASWKIVYQGPVRDGTFGQSVPAVVKRCESCGIERLAESACLKTEAYQSESYRRHIGQDHDVARHYAAHDELARFTLDTIWPLSLRDLSVADIGCGGGSLLDHIRGLPKKLVAVDPAEGFAASLKQRGYQWYTSAQAAKTALADGVDVAFTIQVIEHVDDPKTFLADIRALLKPGGLCVVSTPNRADILMELLPEEFPAFFYRTQHRWAFDAASLTCCAIAAGFSVESVRHVHRYGMANSLLWLRDKKPSGRSPLPAIDAAADNLWRSWCEANQRADNLYLLLRSSA